MTPAKYTPQALFQDGSDLPLFTGYNPAPHPITPTGKEPLKGSVEWNGQQPPVADAVSSLPVYRTTRVVTFFETPPDQWGMLGGAAIEVCSGTLVSILGCSPHDADLFLVEHDGRFAWTYWVTAV